jgi:arginyl-tRNA synthetase
LSTLVESLLRRALEALPETLLPRAHRGVDLEIRHTPDRHGDFATNIAMRLAGPAGRDPRTLAEALIEALPASPGLARVEIAGAGFLNFYLRDSAYHAEIGRVLDAGLRYGERGLGRPGQISIEIAAESASLPMSLRDGRGASYAAALGNLLEAVGYRVDRCHRPSGSGSGVRLASGDQTGAWERLEIGPVHVSSRRSPARSGACTMLSGLREELGDDAARFLFLTRRLDEPLSIDLDLASARSEENPLYCIRYAQARISSLRCELAERGLAHDAVRGRDSLELLSEPEEHALARGLSAFPAVLEQSARSRAPHLLVQYLRGLAADVHVYHRAHRVAVDDARRRDARVSLVFAAQIVLRRGASLLGLSAPEVL